MQHILDVSKHMSIQFWLRSRMVCCPRCFTIPDAWLHPHGVHRCLRVEQVRTDAAEVQAEILEHSILTCGRPRPGAEPGRRALDLAWKKKTREVCIPIRHDTSKNPGKMKRMAKPGSMIDQGEIGAVVAPFSVCGRLFGKSRKPKRGYECDIAQCSNC